MTITDVDQGRVNYALEKGFATHGAVVPPPLHSSPSSSSICNSSSGTSTPSEPGMLTPASIWSINGQLQTARLLAAELVSLAKPPSAAMSIVDDDEDDGVDITFECTGKEVCMHTSLYATRPGGKVIMVGMGTPIQTLPMSVAHLREIDILGIFRYANTYPTGIRLLCSQAIPGGFSIPSLDDMVTHQFHGLENAKQAFELASRTMDDDGNLVLKVVIRL